MFSLYKLIRCQHFKKIYRLQCTSFCILWGIFKKQTSSKAFQHKFHKGYQHCSMCSCNFDCNQRQITNILLTTLRVINDRQYYSHNANVYHWNPFLLLIACTSYAFFCNTATYSSQLAVLVLSQAKSFMMHLMFYMIQ